MNTARPRYSVLDLFDPLVFASTSERDAPSPDSDKENSCLSVNDISITAAFFGRTNKQPEPAPVVLKRRLIDVGDITMDDASMHMMLTEEEELEGGEDENDTMTFSLPAGTPARIQSMTADSATPANATPRTPLGDLVVEQDLTPVARTKTYRRPDLPPSFPAPELNTKHGDSHIAAVIDAVNLSGASFAITASPAVTKDFTTFSSDSDSRNDESTPNDAQTPQITVTHVDPSVEPMPAVGVDTPADPYPSGITSPSSPLSLPESSSSGSRLRLNPPKTSSRDVNRQSIDLHTSFQMQLQSEDASFDLLNDKISFLASGNGMESFLNAMEGDDSFDMDVEEAKLEIALENIRLEGETAGEPTQPSLPAAVQQLVSDSDVSQESIKADLTPSLPTSSEKKVLHKRLSFGYNPGLNSPTSSPSSGPAKALARKPSSIPSPIRSVSSPISPVFAAPLNSFEPNASNLTSTPLKPSRDASTAVPALRIVKRATRFGHEKTGSSGNSASEIAAPEARSAPTLATNAPRVEKVAPTPLVSGPQAMRPAAASSTAGAVRTSGSIKPSEVQLSRPYGSGAGPRRVPIVEHPTNPLSGKLNLGNPKGGSAGPRRIPIATPSMASVEATIEPTTGKAPVVSGIRAPGRYATSTSTTSALPRPASRLPAPSTSGIAKLKMAVSGNGGGVGVGLTKSTSARRMMYGGQ